MPRYLSPLLLCLAVLGGASATPLHAQATQTLDVLLTTLASQQYDLDADGRSFLLDESRNNDYFLLGELHGENEIPALLRAIWPQMWKDGYRHIAAEISPWMARQLESAPPGQGLRFEALWTRRQASDAHAFAVAGTSVLWGCDMEEVQPQFLIRELAALNPHNRSLGQMVRLTNDGYARKMAPELLALATTAGEIKDKVINSTSLRQNLIATLEIEKYRSDADTKMMAQNERELLMKEQFLDHLASISGTGTPSKVLLRFGRNHLHRGYDARGISTLGNFVAEFAIAHGQKAFNVGAFATGGKEILMGATFDADERQDELTFALLADKARFAATVFDLRSLRPLLHQIPQEKRTPLETNLIYWADSYDALICYKSVTPLTPDE
jgi:hypothetical protein